MSKHGKRRVFGKGIQKPFGKMGPAEAEASAAALAAELHEQLRWEKLHQQRYRFDPSGRAASANVDSKELSDEEIDAVIDQAIAESEWKDRQRLLAEGVTTPEGATAEDVERILKRLGPPTFGTERWYQRLLIETLLTIRDGCKDELDPAYEAQQFRFRDPDRYVYLCIPPRHRKLHRLTAEWNRSMPWIGRLLDPKDEDPALFVMAGLKSIGIDAYVIVRLRDLHEERRIG